MNKKICGQLDNLLLIHHVWLIFLATSFIIACAGIPSIKASSPVHRRNSTLTVNSTLHTNKNQTLFTPDGVFELGFYSWRHTNDCQIVYTLAVWYAQIPSTKKPLCGCPTGQWTWAATLRWCRPNTETLKFSMNLEISLASLCGLEAHHPHQT